MESHGVNPYNNLERVVAHVSQLNPAPVFAIFTGDLISDDDARSYHHVKTLAGRLTSPVYFAMGNHDLRQPFRRIVLEEASPGSQRYYYAFDAAGYRFVVLDSVIEGQVAGKLDAAQLNWLDNMLAEGRHWRTVLFMHHPPVQTGVAWLDEYAFENGDSLLGVLAEHPQLQRVFFGHVHMPMQITERGIHFSSAPSSAYQFGDAVTTPKVWSGAPGYGIVHLMGGQLSSRPVYL